jgi:hypothetical protein
MKWTIRKLQDGSFELWVDGQPESQHLKAKDFPQLERQLLVNGFNEEIRVEVLRLLINADELHLRMPRLGRFSIVP